MRAACAQGRCLLPRPADGVLALPCYVDVCHCTIDRKTNGFYNINVAAEAATMEVTGREHVSVRHALRCTCKSFLPTMPVLSPHRSTLPTCSRSRARKRTEARRATTSATSARYSNCTARVDDGG